MQNMNRDIEIRFIRISSKDIFREIIIKETAIEKGVVLRNKIFK